MVLLAITVVYQRRKKEAKRMEGKWDEMKKEDEKRAARGEPEPRPKTST